MIQLKTIEIISIIIITNHMENNFANKCFVCGEKIQQIKYKNKITNLPVCQVCKGSEKEKKKEKNALDSLADGFVCGCI